MPVRPDASHASVRVQIAGRHFELHQAEVSQLVGRLEPAEIRDHFVEIRGRRYPVKQALGAATGLDPSDFTSQHARSALRRLGLPVGRLSTGHAAETPANAPARPLPNEPTSGGRSATSDEPTGSAGLAEALRSYRIGGLLFSATR